jgi:pyruvate/2-oxoglutarate dehydrogenase complex dihydrolipoamide dehydrogenase (E3) component
VVNALFGQFRRFAADYRVIPRVTFCSPEVASVGITEDEARAGGVAIEVTRYGMDDLDRAIADDVAEGFVKVLTAAGTDRILGVTIVGEQAGELIATFVFAMRWKLGLGKILSTIHAYPTLAESARYTAGEWRRARTPQRLLGWAERYHAWRRG